MILTIDFFNKKFHFPLFLYQPKQTIHYYRYMYSILYYQTFINHFLQDHPKFFPPRLSKIFVLQWLPFEE